MKNHREQPRSNKRQNSTIMAQAARGFTKYETPSLATDVMIWRAEKRVEHEAQHGPVRVLWKDGKKVL